MAAANYTPILLYASGTATNVPLAANLTSTATGAEIAINYADGKLFYKDGGGTVQVMASKATGTIGGSTTQVQYNNAGVLAGDPDFTFDGTTVTIANDAVISGLTVGLGAGAITTNTVVGENCLVSNTTGANNAGFGQNALTANTTGSRNSAFGVATLYTNTTGTGNAAFGALGLFSNTTGSNNTALGGSDGSTTLGPLQGNTVGVHNTAVAPNSLSANTTGNYNTAVGSGSLQLSTTADSNTAVGYQAGYSGTTAAFNTYIGDQAGYSNVSGTVNCFIGHQAGYNCTGSSNTFVGGTSVLPTGYLMTTGSNNTILGGFTGNLYGLDIRTASNYIVLSDGAGNPRMIIDPTGSVGIGSATTSAKLEVFADAANIAYFRNTVGTGLYLASGSTSWSTASDENLKDIIEPISDAADKVANLRAVIGKYKTDEEGTRRSFLIAQDVQAVLPEAISETPDGYLGVQYTDVIPLLVAAIKEQQAIIESLTTRIATLEAK